MPTDAITSLDKSLKDLFSDFFDDISREYRSGSPSSRSEYFIGSIVVCQRNDRYELIDGQQRVTTAYLLLCAIRDYILTIDPTQHVEALKLNIAATDADEFGRDVFRYRVELQYEDSGDILELIAKGNALTENIAKSTRSITNIIDAYVSLKRRLEGEFSGDIEAVRQFYAYFVNSVKLIRVLAPSIAHALRIFETINDRGVGLDSMDLLKNLLFMNARAEDYEAIKVLWKELVDLLHTKKEKPLRFLRYYIFSHYDDVERLKEDQIYNWFVDNQANAGYRSQPVAFVRGLLEAAKCYTIFVDGKNADGTTNRYLDNIRYLSRAARQHLILVLAGRHLPRDLFTELCRHLENLFFAYIVTREPTRDFERDFVLWARKLRLVRTKKQLDSFIENNLQDAKQKLSTRFELALSELREGAMNKSQMQYILAKLAQYINEGAWGDREAEIGKFMPPALTIEHILPQTPTENIRSAFDKPEEIARYIEMLGNLTLLERPLNSSISNAAFFDKRHAYLQSNVLLTKSIMEPVSVGVNTSLNRATRNLRTYNLWNSQSIEDRQQLLVDLAHQVWDMPTDTR
jgi:hypothetical protein